MQKGLIEGLISWVFGPMFPYPQEVIAAKEGFMRDATGMGSELASGLLAEWMLYDMRFSSDRTALQELVHRHSDDIDPEERRDIDAMVAAKFRLYEVIAIKRGRGLRLRPVDGGEAVEVRERALTYQVSKGVIAPARLFQESDGTCTILGANSLQLTVDQARQLLAEHSDGLDPRKLLAWFSLRAETAAEMLMARMPPQNERGDEPIEEIMGRMDDALEQAKVGGGIDAALIMEWCEELADGEESMPMHAVMNMSDHEATPDQIRELVAATQALYNATPSERLGGMSPRVRKAMSSSPPSYSSQLTKIGIGGVDEKVRMALKAMKNDFSAACTLFEAVFAELLNGPRVIPDPWRHFANFGVCLAASGEWEAGEHMLALAIELNPNYPFALDMAAELEHRRTSQKLRRDRAHCAEYVSRTFARNYADFLLWTGIDFSTEDLAKSKRITLGKVSDVWKNRGSKE